MQAVDREEEKMKGTQKRVEIRGPVLTTIITLTISKLRAMRKQRLVILAGDLGLPIYGNWEPTKAELIDEIWDRADKRQPKEDW